MTKSLNHKHHIIPKHRGGLDLPENIIEIPVVRHAMFHYCEWKMWGCEYDYLAWKGLTGRISTEEISRQVVSYHNSNRTEEERKFISERTKEAMDNPRIKEAIIAANKRRAGEKRNYTHPFAKTYKGISPSGEEFIFTGTRKFADEHGLKHQAISAVLRGIQTHHHGWKFEYCEDK